MCVGSRWTQVRPPKKRATARAMVEQHSDTAVAEAPREPVRSAWAATRVRGSSAWRTEAAGGLARLQGEVAQLQVRVQAGERAVAALQAQLDAAAADRRRAEQLAAGGTRLD